MLQPLPKFQRQCGNLLQRFHSLPVHRLQNLLRAIAWLTRFGGQNSQFLPVHAQQR